MLRFAFAGSQSPPAIAAPQISRRRRRTLVSLWQGKYEKFY
jgi:hypothetical protein